MAPLNTGPGYMGCAKVPIFRIPEGLEMSEMVPINFTLIEIIDDGNHKAATK